MNLRIVHLPLNLDYRSLTLLVPESKDVYAYYTCTPSEAPPTPILSYTIAGPLHTYLCEFNDGGGFGRASVSNREL